MAMSSFPPPSSTRVRFARHSRDAARLAEIAGLAFPHQFRHQSSTDAGTLAGYCDIFALLRTLRSCRFRPTVIHQD